MFIGVVAFWTVASTTFWRGTSLSTPSAMSSQATRDGFHFYANHAAATLERACLGFAWGNGLALLTAVVLVLAPNVENVSLQMALVAQCLPIVAIGPLIEVIFGGRTAAVFLAALVVSFTTLVTVLAGARSASQTSLDLIVALGGRRHQVLTKLQFMAAMPSVMSALKIAIPGAMLGAVLGEYLGGLTSGLGVALNAAQYQSANARLWNLALVTVALTMGPYAVAAGMSRRIFPWSAEQSEQSE